MIAYANAELVFRRSHPNDPMQNTSLEVGLGLEQKCCQVAQSNLA